MYIIINSNPGVWLGSLRAKPSKVREVGGVREDKDILIWQFDYWSLGPVWSGDLWSTMRKAVVSPERHLKLEEILLGSVFTLLNPDTPR